MVSNQSTGISLETSDFGNHRDSGKDFETTDIPRCHRTKILST